jgi:hypothetical protein
MYFDILKINKLQPQKNSFKRNWMGFKRKKRSFLTSFLNWLPLLTEAAAVMGNFDLKFTEYFFHPLRYHMLSENCKEVCLLHLSEIYDLPKFIDSTCFHLSYFFVCFPPLEIEYVVPDVPARLSFANSSAVFAGIGSSFSEEQDMIMPINSTYINNLLFILSLNYKF